MMVLVVKQSQYMDQLVKLCDCRSCVLFEAMHW